MMVLRRGSGDAGFVLCGPVGFLWGVFVADDVLIGLDDMMASCERI